MRVRNSSQGKNILREIALQNPVVSARLTELRRIAARRVDFDYIGKEEPWSGRVGAPMLQWGTCSPPPPILMRRYVIVLAIGLACITIALGTPLYAFTTQYWDKVVLALGCMFLGAGIILAVRKVGESPLRNISMPSESFDEPLKELENLAVRSVSRLRAAYYIHVCLVISMVLVFLGIVYWSIYMVTQRRMEYGVAFGSGGVGMLVLSRWKWQPFEKMARARKMADDADILATGLRLRMRSISEIDEPERRARAQWKAIREYLAIS